MSNIRWNKDFLVSFADLRIKNYCSIKREDSLNPDNSGLNLKSVTSDHISVAADVIKTKLRHLDVEDDYKLGKSFPARYNLSVNNYDQDEYADLYLYDSTDSSHGETEYPICLMDTYHSLVQLDVAHLSVHELKYTFRSILRQIKEVLALLDRECIDTDIVLKQILDLSKVLNREVTEIHLYLDMLKTVKLFLITHSIETERVVLNQLVELEIFLLYSRLKAVIGENKIVDELVFSPEIRLSDYSTLKRVRILHTIERSFSKVYPDYFAFKDRKPKIDCSNTVFMERRIEEISIINSNIQSRGISNNFELILVTAETIKSVFLIILGKSEIYRYSNEDTLQEIRDLTEKAEIFFGRPNAKSLTAISILALPPKKVGLYVSNKLRCRALKRAVVEALNLELSKM